MQEYEIADTSKKLNKVTKLEEESISDCKEADYINWLASFVQRRVDLIFDRSDIGELSKMVMAESKEEIDADVNLMMN